MDPQTDRHPDFRPRLQHDGADRGREATRIIPPKSPSWFRTGRTPPDCSAPRAEGIATEIVDHTDLRQGSRRLRARLQDGCCNHRIEIVCLAGFMRVLTAWFCRAMARTGCLNIHPALLPAFKGLDTHRRAIEAGMRRAWCDRPFRGVGNGFRPDHRAGRGPGAAGRHRRNAFGARAGDRASHLSDGAETGSIGKSSRWWTGVA